MNIFCIPLNFLVIENECDFFEYPLLLRELFLFPWPFPPAAFLDFDLEFPTKENAFLLLLIDAPKALWFLYFRR
jgi:hypothetical protein